ncbi:MAG: sigma-70 family RNA polymerase sigma factor [Clostridiales bacterium]|nr:sigma-70 family RNA polymerase sigma factor [Clostridiales bacterium]
MLQLLDLLKYLFICTGYVSNSNLFPEPLTSEEEKIYVEKYINGDIEAKHVLITRNLRLVAYVVKKYSTTQVDQDDLISIGTIGLIKGIERYNNEKGTKLSTYVSRCIENEILMYLRSNKKIKNETSINNVIGQDKEGNELSYINILECEQMDIEDKIDLKEKIKLLYKKIGECLKDREKQIIELRFGLNGKKGKTQSEIGKMMGISRSYVSRIETKAINKLKKELIKNDNNIK